MIPYKIDKQGIQGAMIQAFSLPTSYVSACITYVMLLAQHLVCSVNSSTLDSKNIPSASFWPPLLLTKIAKTAKLEIAYSVGIPAKISTHLEKFHKIYNKQLTELQPLSAFNIVGS